MKIRSSKGVTMKREKLAEGIRFKKHPSRKHGLKFDRYFSIYYKMDGRLIEEGVGWESQKWTESKVKALYLELQINRKDGNRPFTYREKLSMAEAERVRMAKATEDERVMAENANLTVDQVFQKYCEFTKTSKGQNRARTEVYFYKAFIQPFIGSVFIQDATQRQILKIKEHALGKLSEGSTGLILAVVRSIFKYAKDQKVIVENVASEVSKPKVDNRRMRTLSQAEAELLLDTLKDRTPDTYRIALFSLQMGLRAGEVLKLTWADIDTENNRIAIRETKSKKNRWAYPTPKVIAELEAMRAEGRQGRLFPYPKVSVTFGRIVKELGFNNGVKETINKVVFHTLRHTFATWLVNKGVSIYTLKELLGHSTLAMTERYAKVSEDALRQAMAVFADDKVIPIRANK